eukprot:TRINITY_DN3033_c0_g1_i1.p1 TRINITY_DN3033_c0_g1~~TRINITY_DN3033_c0_g1_i1.p1  ORF type:complete len:208 (+),score=61.29 TRINITY_DN3033_c0_g1_i1:123-746(+)
MRSTPSIRAIHTQIRDHSSSGDVFVYQVDRLCRLVTEFGLSFLPFSTTTITTPAQMPFLGAKFHSKICGVSVVRSGEAMERGLREVCRDIRIGKIVIQQSANKKSGPRLYYCNLPDDISERRVLLLDPVLSASHTVKMAIRVLLDHGVPESNIIFLSLIVTKAGVESLSRAFPRVTVVTSAVDEGVDQNLFAVPGLGCFGDRYFYCK